MPNSASLLPRLQFILLVQALAVDYARSQLRSELAWTKAKLVVVAHMASGLRAKLAQAQAERAQAGGSWGGGWLLHGGP